MAGDVLDLFGNPWVDKPRKRGRPPHEVTVKSRKRVSMLVALGWANPRIAGAIGITLPTLHRYYFYEIGQRATARDQLEARRLEMAWDMAEAGNVGALREFGRLLDRSDQMEVEREMGARPPEEVKKSERVGKKEQDAQRAIDADADLMAELESEAAAHARH